MKKEADFYEKWSARYRDKSGQRSIKYHWRIRTVCATGKKNRKDTVIDMGMNRSRKYGIHSNIERKFHISKF